MQFSTEYSVSCSECSECTTKEELKAHLMLVHMGNWTPYKCEKCPMLRMATVGTLKAHQKMCHPNWREKTLIYYYSDEKETQLKELLLRSLEGQSNTPEFESDIIPFELRSTAAPCFLPTTLSSLPSCSMSEADTQTPVDTSLEVDMETAQEEEVESATQTAQRYHPVKEGFRHVGVRLVCRICQSVFNNQQESSNHQCHPVDKQEEITPFGSTSPPCFLPTNPSCSSVEGDNRQTPNTSLSFEIESTERPSRMSPVAQRYTPAKNELRHVRRFVCKVCQSLFTNLEQASNHQCPPVASPVKAEVNQDISDASAVAPAAKRIPLFNFEKFAKEKKNPVTPLSSNFVLKQASPTPEASTLVEVPATSREVRKRKAPEIDYDQDVSAAKSKALLPDVDVVPKITATIMESTSPKDTETSTERRPNAKMVKTELNRGTSETSAVASAANFKRFPFENEKKNSLLNITPSSSNLSNQPTPTLETLKPVAAPATPRDSKSPEIDYDQDVSPAKSKALLPDVDVASKITATMELRNREVSSVVESTNQKDTETSPESKPNVKMVVLDSDAIRRLESSRPLIRDGASGFVKSRKRGGLIKWWHGYHYICRGCHGDGSDETTSTWYWRCGQKKPFGCGAILHTKGGAEGSERLKVEHNHKPDPDALQVKLAVEDIMLEALRTKKLARQIVAEMCGNGKLTEAQRQRLPTDQALMRQIRKVRQRKAQEEARS